MKKIFAFVIGAALMLSATQAFAQLSVGAGWLNSTETTKYTKTNDAPDKFNYNGLYIGGQYNLNIVGNFGVAPGFYMSALFGQVVNQYKQNLTTETYRARYREIALNIPVNLNYTFDLGRDFGIFVYAGPVFQLGVLSKSTYDFSASTLGVFASGQWNYNEYTCKLKDSNGKEYDLKETKIGDYALNEVFGYRNMFNIYLGGGVGFQAGDFQVIVGYDHSMLNCSKINGENTSRSQIKVGLGLSF